MQGASEKGERRRLNKLGYHERLLRSYGFALIAGVDEAGRGPLAGPVVAAAVILPETAWLPGIRDSKLLSASQRDRLFTQIFSVALAVGTGAVDHQDIDRINILNATRCAMLKAVSSLLIRPDFLLIDAVLLPQSAIEQTGLIHGDLLSISIAAASVVAKVTRDRIMERYHQDYPEYNFLSHKGYGTPEHLSNIRKFGASPIHRKTFKGVMGVSGAVL